MLGYAIDVLDDRGNKVPVSTLGNLVFKLPLPPGCLPTLWQEDEKFREGYLSAFSGYYNSSDAGYLDEDGYVFVMSRTDDIINVAGHSLSTGTMEGMFQRIRMLQSALLLAWLMSSVPCGFIVLKNNIKPPLIEVDEECIKKTRVRGSFQALFLLLINYQKSAQVKFAWHYS